MDHELYQSMTNEDLTYQSYVSSHLPELESFDIKEMQNAKIIRLNSIKVENFKSFQGEHSIGPFLQFTGVVGPNGGGKSNVVDSISFVFGLAFPLIRCVDQSQIIYNPDYYNQEDIVQDKAIVVLEFEVKNYRHSTLTLTRAIDTKARTQVFIGDHQVSQKQFNWFLMKNQFIIPAKNFLLSQSEGDRMLKLSPKEFAQFIEWVSGSIQFKQQMEVVNKQNEEYLEQLAQVLKSRGILKQKQRTITAGLIEVQKVQQINQVIDKQWKTLFIIKLVDVEKQIKEIKKEKIRESQDVQDEIKLYDQKQIDQENLINNLDIKIEDLKIQQNQKKAEDNLKGHDKEQHVVKIEKIKQQINQTKYKITLEQKEKKSLLDDFEICNDELQLKEKQLKIYNDKRKIKLPEKVIEEYRSLKKIFDQENSQVRMQILDIKSNQKTYQSIMDNASHEIHEFKQQIKLYQDNIQEYQGDLDKFDLEQQSLQKSIQIYVERLLSLQVKQQAESHEVKKLLNENEKLNREIILFILKEAHNERERQHHLIMAQLKTKVPNFLGDVASLCNPTQEKYSLPLKLAFGQAKLSAYVVKTVEALKETEKYLLTQFTSKMVIIVDTIKQFDDQQIKDRLDQCAESYRKDTGDRTIKTFLAYKLIVTDAELEVLYKQLLKGIVICNSFQFAIHLRKQKIPGITTIITDDCKSINIGGSIVSSGNVDRFTRMREFRKNNYQNKGQQEFNQDKINKMIIGNKEKIDSLKADSVVNEIRLISLQKQSGEDAINRITANKQRIMKQIKDAEQEVKELTGKLKETQEEYNLKAKQYEKLETRKASLEQEVVSKQQLAFKDFTKTHKVQHDQLEYLDEQNQLQEEIDMKINQINKLKITVQDKKNQIDQRDQRIKEALQTIKQYEEELESLNDQKKQSMTPKFSKTFEDQIKQLRQQSKLENNKLTDIINKKLQLQNEVLFINSKRLNIAKNLKTLIKKRERIINEANQNSVKLFKNEIGSQIYDQDNLDVSNFDIDDIDEDPFKKTYNLNNRVTQLEKSIRQNEREIELIVRNTLRGRPDGAALQREFDQFQHNLEKFEQQIHGINDNYKHSKEKYDLLRAQRRQIFLDFIAKLGVNLSKIYNLIFPGYHSNPEQFLSVEDQVDPYDLGVTYNACPPDKRLVQNQSEQLSGGERVLASFALIMSINKIIGLRLLLLDEVDSNLDPENRDKLVKILSQEKDDQQVILVSHNPDCFVNAQSLVGVTIQSGRSTSEAFSIQLNESEEQQIKIQQSISMSYSKNRSSSYYIFQD
ncbi:hypothetical protein pb186bvf_014856 [Paramecium bursaria]